MSRYSRHLAKVLAELRKNIDQLQFERAELRHQIVLNRDKEYADKKSSAGEECEESFQSIEEIQEEIHKVEKERDYLLKELLSLTEENSDLSSTLDTLINEKCQLRKDIDKAKEELETCKQLIDFLVLERDEMTQEIKTKDNLLDCYTHLFNKDNMFHFKQTKKIKK